MERKNKINRAWEILEARKPIPQRALSILEIGYQDLKREVRKAVAGNSSVITEMVSSLYAGDVWIVRDAFPVQFMVDLKAKAKKWMNENPSSFHKMLEGAPDFHRDIDLETGKNYSFRCCKQTAAFYRWNSDPLNLWPTVTERWRVAKTIAGYEPDQYEKNTPKDGVIDRVQVVRYLPAIGYLEPHQDAHQNYRVNISAYMNKRGVDYEGGGFYAVGRNDEVIEVEEHLNTGDAVLSFPSILHGVAPCDRHKAPDWQADDGRWSLLMYCADSDHIEKRFTGVPSKMEIKGSTPWN